MKQNEQNLWEKAFRYPSFNFRFWTTIVFVLILIISITSYILIGTKLISGAQNILSFLALVVQAATFLLALFAAFYALRQLIEARTVGLETAADNHLQKRNYTSAIKLWKESLYIKPDPATFLNLCEAMLLSGDFEMFDRYIGISEVTGTFKKQFSYNSSDRAVLLYLKCMRQLFVENLGEAKIQINLVLKLPSEIRLAVAKRWNFLDLQTSSIYLDLAGDCRSISDNLVLYFQGKMVPAHQAKFENGEFSYTPTTEEDPPLPEPA